MSEEQTQAVAAVGFLVLAFPEEQAADDALKALKEAKKKKQIYYEDAAVVRKDASGEVHYHETGDMSTGKGAGVGALIGGVLGILGGPVGVALGASAGAAVGAIAAHGDNAFKDESLNTVGVALKPGTSALAATTSDAFLKALHEQVSEEEIHATVVNLAAEISRRLEEGKSMALGLILSEEGLAIEEVAVDEQSTEVVGTVITSDGVIAGAAAITEEGMAYKIGVATEEGTVVEEGVVTDEGTVIVDDVQTDEGEIVTVSETVPVTVTATTAGEVEPEEDATAEKDDDEDAPAETEG